MPTTTITLLDKKPLRIIRERNGVSLRFSIQCDNQTAGKMDCNIITNKNCNEYQKDICQIQTFVVQEEHRKKGYGTLLLKFACVYAAEENVKMRIYTESLESDSFFRKFFNKHSVTLGLPDRFKHQVDLRACLKSFYR